MGPKLFGGLLLAVTLFVSPANANTITIKGFWPGGVISEFMQFWEAVGSSGDDVAVDGACASACTFLLAYVPEDRICITGRASFGFHEVSSGDNVDPVMTPVYSRMFYPPWVMDYIKAHGGLQEDPLWMPPEDMLGHLHVCPGATVVPQDGLLAPAAPEPSGAQQPGAHGRP